MIIVFCALEFKECLFLFQARSAMMSGFGPSPLSGAQESIVNKHEEKNSGRFYVYGFGRIGTIGLCGTSFSRTFE